MEVFKYETPGTFTFTWPTGETEAIVIVQGPGGRAGTSTLGEGGGGGGAWARAVITKTHATATVVVGAGAAPGGSTGPSSFKQGTAVTFPGYFSAGAGANGSGRSGGAGGFPPSGTGVVSYAGGAGGSTPNVVDQGGGGGGAAGCRRGVGGNGQPNSGATGGAGGIPACLGDPGRGGSGGDNGASGTDGVWPGGGAGGGGANGGNTGSGAGGYVHVIVPPPDEGIGLGQGPARCCDCFVEALGMPEVLQVEFTAPEVDTDEGIPSPQCHSTLDGFYGGGTEDLYCPDGGDTYDGETFLGCRPKVAVKREVGSRAFPNCTDEAYYSPAFCPNPEDGVPGWPSFEFNLSAQYLSGATAPLQAMSPAVLELVTTPESTPLAIPGGLTPIGGGGSTCCDLVYATRGPANVWSSGSLVPAPYHKTLGTLPLPSWEWEQPAYSRSGGHNCQGTQFPFPGDPPWAISMPNKVADRQTTHTVGVAVLKLRLCVDGTYTARFMVSMSSGYERHWDADTGSAPGLTTNRGMTLTYTLNYQDSGTITGDWTFAKVKEIVMDMQTSARNSMFSPVVVPRSNFNQQVGNFMAASNEDVGLVVGGGIIFAPYECTGECDPPGDFPFLGYYSVYSATAPAGGFTWYYWATGPGTAQVK